MATFKEEIYFSYDGVSSRDFGLIAVDLGSGLFEEDLGPSRSIVKTETAKGNKTIFHGIKEESRNLSLTLAFEEGFDDALIDDIVRWLFKGYYKPLIFEKNPNRIMFAMLEGSSQIIHNGIEQGYFTINLDTNSPYIFSEEKTNTKTITTSGVLAVTNQGHLDAYPELSIKKVGAGDLTIGIDGRNVKITNLDNNEDIYIDTEREIIETSKLGAYRYDSIVAGELEDLHVGYGVKEYVITGSCQISYRFREMYRA